MQGMKGQEMRFLCKFLFERVFGWDATQKLIITGDGTYSQLVRVASVLSMRSMGGHWNCNCTSLASEGLILYLSSHLFSASLIVVALVAITMTDIITAYTSRGPGMG